MPPAGPAYSDLIDGVRRGHPRARSHVDRSKLGPIVFADPAALKRLNAIVHPKMFARMGEMVARCARGGEHRPIVVEAAILIEANWQPLFNEIWLVTAARERVIERIERDRG